MLYEKHIGPINCTTMELSALLYLHNRVECSEPCSLISMKDIGKNVIYRTFCDEVKQHNKQFSIVTIHATKEEELRKFLDEYTPKAHMRPVLYVVNLSVGRDVSWFIYELEQLRLKFGPQFCSVVFSHFTDVHEALVKQQNILFRSLFRVLPLTKTDVNNVLDSFEKRFGTMVDAKIRNTIYDLSGGHTGLIKSLYLEYAKAKKLDSIQELLTIPEVAFRLKELCDDLPKKAEHDVFFKQFGFVTPQGKLFSPLLAAYLNVNEEKKVINYDVLFTPTEKKIFDFLISKIDTLISRDSVSQALWGAEWEEKYSDWALDQVMHRIREKLKKVRAPYSLKTKKGVGFVLS